MRVTEKVAYSHMKNLLQTALSEAKATKNQANVTSDKGN
jgi:hypothetical protein